MANLAEGKFGILTEPENLGKTLLNLLQNSEERAKWEKLGVERAQDFDWENIVLQYEQLYQGG